MKNFVDKAFRYMMAALGFSAVACGKGTLTPDDKWGAMVMYGTPYVEFKVQGKVVDEDGNALKGIGLSRYGYVHAQTDEKGQFSVSVDKTGFSLPEKDTVLLNFHDVDGPENGAYESATVSVLCNLREDTSNMVWKEGEYENASEVTVTLKKKEK